MKTQFKVAMWLLTAVIVMGGFSSVTAQVTWPAVYVDVTEIEGLVDGYIPYGSPVDLVIPVRFTNVDEARTCISNGYNFKSQGIQHGDIIGEWNPEYCWNGSMPMCWIGGDIGFFDMGIFINYFSNGVGFAGLTGVGEGLPADFDDIAYYITVEDVAGDPGEVLTMDSTWWLPANIWVWCPEAYPDWGGPYDLVIGNGPISFTWCTPQPTILNASDPLLEVHFQVPNPEEVDLESIRVLNIPPYEGYPIVADNVITTACFLNRFIGVSGFRPIAPEGVQSTYTVSFNTFDGQAHSLIGDYVLQVVNADVTLDGIADINDVQFMNDYFWGGGKTCAFEEFMDVDGNGQIDARDAMKVIEIVGM